MTEPLTEALVQEMESFVRKESCSSIKSEWSSRPGSDLYKDLRIECFPLGNGCNGIVFPCESGNVAGSSIPLAIKVMVNYGHEQSFTRVFQNEFRLWETLPFHPGIVQLLKRFTEIPTREMIKQMARADLRDCLMRWNHITQQNESLPTMMLVMERFPHNLESYLQSLKENQLTTHLILKICLDIADSIFFLKSHRIVHLDVKKNNFLVSPSGKVALCDFGLAIQLNNDDFKITLSGPAPIGGNTAHLAPEVLHAPIRDGSRRMDYSHQPSWELGVIFFEIATGRHPFGRYPEGYSVESPIPDIPDVPSRNIRFPDNFRILVKQLLNSDGPSRPRVETVLDVMNKLVNPPEISLHEACAQKDLSVVENFLRTHPNIPLLNQNQDGEAPLDIFIRTHLNSECRGSIIDSILIGGLSEHERRVLLIVGKFNELGNSHPLIYGAMVPLGELILQEIESLVRQESKKLSRNISSA